MWNTVLFELGWIPFLLKWSKKYRWTIERVLRISTVVHYSTLEYRYYLNSLKIGYWLAFTKAFWKHWFQWFVSKFISMKSTSMKKIIWIVWNGPIQGYLQIMWQPKFKFFITKVCIKGSSFLFQAIGSRFLTDKPDNWFSFQIIEFHLNVRILHMMELQMNFI